jgi:antitoxin VapB
MALQIQTLTAVRAVEELSEITGENVDTAVEIAVRERIDRLRQSDEEAQRRAKVYALVAELQEMFRGHPEIETDHGKLLYGEDGLPK